MPHAFVNGGVYPLLYIVRCPTQHLAAIAALLFLLMLPTERANAVQVATCGSWYSAGGGFEVNDFYEDNTCAYELTYFEAITPGHPIDLQFNVTAGQTYYFTTYPLNTVWNETLYDWDDYHFELGAAVNSEFIQFSGADTPSFTGDPISSVFTILTKEAHSLSFEGGVVPISDGGVDFSLQVHVPTTFSGSQFTLRQHFSVPEPTTLFLAALGLFGLGLVRQRGIMSKP